PCRRWMGWRLGRVLRTTVRRAGRARRRVLPPASPSWLRAGVVLIWRVMAKVPQKNSLYCDDRAAIARRDSVGIAQPHVPHQRVTCHTTVTAFLALSNK